MEQAESHHDDHFRVLLRDRPYLLLEPLSFMMSWFMVLGVGLEAEYDAEM